LYVIVIVCHCKSLLLLLSFIVIVIVTLQYCVHCLQYCSVPDSQMSQMYADMMNRRVNMVLVRDHFKQAVIEAFTEHRYKYGVDDTKIREYITTTRAMD